MHNSLRNAMFSQARHSSVTGEMNRRSLEPIYDSSDSEGDSSVVLPPLILRVNDEFTGADSAPDSSDRRRRPLVWIHQASRWLASTVTRVTDTLLLGGETEGGEVSQQRHNSDAASSVQLHIMGHAQRSQAEDAAHALVHINGPSTSDQKSSFTAAMRSGSASADDGFEDYVVADDSTNANESFYSEDEGVYSSQMPRNAVADRYVMQLDLIDVMEYYLKNPNDAVFSLVSTALASRSINFPITGEELLHARGDQSLVSLIIENGYLSKDDPQIKVELMRLLNNKVVPSQTHNDRVNPSSFPFIRDLLSVECVRITEAQRDLLRASGFEFVQLLHKFPHVQKEIPAPSCLSIEFWSRFSRKLDVPLLLMGIMIIYLDIVALTMVVAHFFNMGDDVRGWLTLVVWVGGDYLSLVTMKIMTSTKADESVYGDAMADFPTPYLKIVPCMPLFESFCFVAAFKHKLIARSNYAVQHDLVAMFTLTCITHSLFFATIQIMLQSYFHAWTGDEALRHSMGFQLLTISTLISLCTALPLYLRFVVTFDSVNSVGFAFFGDQMPVDTQPPVSKFTRVLAFVLLYFLEFNLFLLVIAIIHVSSCSTMMIAWISVAGIIVVFTVAMFVLTFAMTRSVLRASRWLWLPVCIQVAFTLFFNLYNDDSDDGKDDCRLFLIIGGMTIIYGYVGWGMLISIFSVWGIYKLYISYKKDHSQVASHTDQDLSAQQEHVREPFGGE